MMNPSMNIKMVAPSRVSTVLPAVIILDASGSMANVLADGRSRLDHAKDMLRLQVEQIRKASMLRDSVELTVIVCAGSGPRVLLSSAKIAELDVDKLIKSVPDASGMTPLGECMLEALRLTDLRKSELRLNQIPYQQPVISIVTDGAETSDQAVMANAFAETDKRLAERKLCLICAGIGNDEDMYETLDRFLASTDSRPLRIQDAKGFIENVRLLHQTMLTVKMGRPVYKVTPLSQFAV